MKAACLVGAVVGALSGAWLVALQIASASVAGMLWTVDSPAASAVLYPGLGAALGAVGGPLAEVVRRLVLRRVDPWAWSAACLGLGGYALRALLTVRLKSAGIPGGFWVAAGAQLVLLIALVIAALVVLRRSRPPGPLAATASAVVLMLPSLAAVYLLHVLFFGNKYDLGGPLVLGATAVSGVLGLVVLGLEGRGKPLPRAASALIVVALLAFGLAAQRPKPFPERTDPPPDGPNMLLVVLDTLRADAVSAYGAVEGTTPRLDAFADEGVLWEDAIVPGNWTIPGHASLFTGAMVTRHGTGMRRKELRPYPGGPGTPRLDTMAETFYRLGWQTAAFVNNGQLNPVYGFDRGFEEYHEVWRARKGDYDSLGAALRKRFGLGVLDKGGERTVRGLARWFADRADDERPWFCFVNFMEPHGPYDAPLPWLGMFTDEEPVVAEAHRFSIEAHERKYGEADAETGEKLWQLYLGCVAYQDYILGLMLDALEDAGLADDTIVVFTSDHGENFGWRGQLFHGLDLNEGVLWVPLIARGPGIPAGHREPAPASLVDVLPTLLDLAGQPQLEPDPGRTGVVLPPIGTDPLTDRIRVAERYGGYLVELAEFLEHSPGLHPYWGLERSAIYRGDLKLHFVEREEPELLRHTGPPSPPIDEGWIRLDDEDELSRMIGTLSERRAMWKRAFDPAVSELPEIDEETRKQLDALGY